MDESQRELWRRLESFQLDNPDASLTFSRRLARENGWDVAFARCVVDEYKRFVFLAMTSGHQVTPSDEVDQAWHLHLTYTRSYWGELCGEVLGRPLHHGPTKGGESEGVRFEDQYERTLASYRKAFNAEPPSDIWPPSAVRFGEAADFVRVNRRRVWLLNKPLSRPAPRSWAAGIIGLGLGLPLAATDYSAAVLFIVFLVFLFGMIALANKDWGPKKRRRRNNDGSGCGTFGAWFGNHSDDSGCSSDSGCGGGGCGGCGGD